MASIKTEFSPIVSDKSNQNEINEQQKECYRVLLQAINIGQSKGCYTVRDSANIYQALTVLNEIFE